MIFSFFASGVVENLLDYVREFGFVPNGGRVYYLDRCTNGWESGG
jgi:neutral trehalase